jgi:mono/diheme cytochrome c family protein
MQSTPSNPSVRSLGTVILLAALAMGIFAAIYGANNWGALAAARKLKNPVPATPENVAGGKQAYGEHCQACHGEKGDGRGEKAAELSVAPGDFTDPRKMSGITDGELYWQITKGRLPMPAFAGKLDEEKRWQAVDYIRTFLESPPGNLAPSSRRQ